MAVTLNSGIDVMRDLGFFDVVLSKFPFYKQSNQDQNT